MKDYVISCHSCQEYLLVKPSYKFDGCSLISGLFKCLFLDFLGPFPASKSGFKYILVIVDQLSRFPFLFPCKSQTSEVVVEALDKYVIPLASLPENLMVDGGSCFTSPKFEEYCERLNIKLNINIAYQPEWMGAVETVNRVVRYSLAKTCEQQYDFWDKFIPGILLGLRVKVSSATGC